MRITVFPTRRTLDIQAIQMTVNQTDIDVVNTGGRMWRRQRVHAPPDPPCISTMLTFPCCSILFSGTFEQCEMWWLLLQGRLGQVIILFGPWLSPATSAAPYYMSGQKYYMVSSKSELLVILKALCYSMSNEKLSWGTSILPQDDHVEATYSICHPYMGVTSFHHHWS